MKTKVFGSTKWGLPILGWRWENNGPEVLILGGIHGDEIEGVIAARALIGQLHQNFDLKLNLTIIPEANPEGVLLKTRGNSSGVDLNRNLPTRDWSPEIKTPRYHPGPFPNSEPENRTLSALLDDLKPIFVLSLHSWHPVLNVNGDCLRQAEIIARTTGYKIDAEIGYPTPGCLGTYAGIERGLPTLTYEIERGLIATEIIRVHVPAIFDALKICQ